MILDQDISKTCHHAWQGTGYWDGVDYDKNKKVGGLKLECTICSEIKRVRWENLKDFVQNNNVLPNTTTGEAIDDILSGLKN